MTIRETLVPRHEDWEGKSADDFHQDYLIPLVNSMSPGESVRIQYPEHINSELNSRSIAESSSNSSDFRRDSKLSSKPTRRKLLSRLGVVTLAFGAFVLTGQSVAAAQCECQYSKFARCNIYAPGRGYVECRHYRHGGVTHCVNTVTAVTSCPSDTYTYCVRRCQDYNTSQ